METGTTDAASTPIGRAAVVDALIGSATELFAERGLDDVSVREIAAAAGVNHALVFRHFGSKAGLLRAVLQGQRRTFGEAAGGGTTREELSAEIGLYTVILARILLDGDAGVLDDVDHPVANGLRARATDAGLDDDRAGQFAATVMALELGWHLFLPALGTATGIDSATSDERLNDSTNAIIDTLLERWRSEA